MGATIVNLSPAVADELGMDGAAQGVVITAVAQRSLAQQAGFQKNDRIITLNGTPVKTTAELERLHGASSGFWRITMERNGQTAVRSFRF
jgi:S1-C subfamily serine protease